MRASLSALARLSATLVALLGDRGEVGDTGDVSPRPSRPCSARPFRAALRERFQKRTRRLKRGTQPREQQPAAKLPKEVRFPTWQNWTGQSRNWLFGMPILVLGSRHFLMVKRLHTMGFILLISLLLEVDAHFKAAKPNSIELTLPRKDLRWSRADVQFYSTTGIGQVFSRECTTFLLDRLHLPIYLEDQNLAFLCWEGPSV